MSRSFSARTIFRRRMMLSWPASSCKYMTSRKVRCASVEFRNASKHFLSATTARVFLSTAFHTTPYACARKKTAAGGEGVARENCAGRSGTVRWRSAARGASLHTNRSTHASAHRFRQFHSPLCPASVQCRTSSARAARVHQTFSGAEGVTGIKEWSRTRGAVAKNFTRRRSRRGV